MSAAISDDAIIDQLAHGPLHRFADWPNAEVPKVAIGIYTVWRDEELLYVGIAGKSKNLPAMKASGGKSGLHSRLGSHASGQRAGDKFCVYVADKILAAAGHSATDDFVRDYVCHHLAYRYFVFDGLTSEDLTNANRLERLIQAGDTPLGKPLLNPRKAPKKRAARK
jgi:hypothetical protein